MTGENNTTTALAATPRLTGVESEILSWRPMGGRELREWTGEEVALLGEFFSLLGKQKRFAGLKQAGKCVFR
jgi:hypothetical protein